MGFFNSYAIKAGRKKFSATVVEDLSLKVTAELGRPVDLSDFVPSITRVAESIYDGDVAPYISKHPSIHKAQALLAQKRAVDFMYPALLKLLSSPMNGSAF